MNRGNAAELMRRPNRFFFSLFLIQALSFAAVAPAPAASEGPVWPQPPADPVVRLETVLGKLGGFEVAVQGPTDGPPRRIQKLKRPSGVAFDARGRLLVTDPRQGVLLQIDPDLGVVLVLGSGTTPSLKEPRGVAVAADGTIYVADAGLRRIVAFEPSGQVSAVYGDDGLSEPTDVALSPDGSLLYVADASGNNLAIFDRESRRRLQTLGGRGPGVGEFILPTAVEFDSAGNLLIADQLNARVQIFDADGAFSRAIYLQRFSRPHDLAADAAGRLYVTDRAQSRIQIYGADLDPLLTVGRNGLRDGEFLAIGGIAAAGDRLAVIDQAGGRVQLFRLYGLEEALALQREMATTWPEPAEAAQPEIPSTREEEPARPAEDPEPLEATRLAEAPTEEALDAVSNGEPPALTAEDVGVPSVASAGAGAAADVARPSEEIPAADREARLAQELLDLVHAWAGAWSAQDVDSYLAFYAGSFRPEGGASRDQWAAGRRERVSRPSSIEVAVEIVETRLEEEAAEVTFIQSYRSDRFSDRVRKRLRLVQVDGTWRIERETVLETL